MTPEERQTEILNVIQAATVTQGRTLPDITERVREHFSRLETPGERVSQAEIIDAAQSLESGIEVVRLEDDFILQGR